MKTLIVEIKDKSKNEFIMELLSSFSYLTIKDKKEFKGSDKKLVKKYKKAFNEVEIQPGLNKNFNPNPELPKEL